MPNVRC